jgi:hypothetical protein
MSQIHKYSLKSSLGSYLLIICSVMLYTENSDCRPNLRYTHLQYVSFKIGNGGKNSNSKRLIVCGQTVIFGKRYSCPCA